MRCCWSPLRARRMAGARRLRAIIEASDRLLRPILMTTPAMVAGMLPMASGLGGGGGAQTAPLGRAVIGGLLASLSVPANGVTGGILSRLSPTNRRVPIPLTLTTRKARSSKEHELFNPHSFEFLW